MLESLRFALNNNDSKKANVKKTDSSSIKSEPLEKSGETSTTDNTDKKTKSNSKITDDVSDDDHEATQKRKKIP